MKMLRIFCCLVLLSTGLAAQSSFAPLNADYYHLLDRYEIKSGKFSNSFFSSFKPYRRNQVASFLYSGISDPMGSQVDEFNIGYLKNDNWEFSNIDSNNSQKPLFGKLYRKKSDFVNVNVKDFDLHLNPVIYWSIGQDSDSESRPFINTRGVQLRGRIDDKIAFYSFIGENQVVFPSYGQDYVKEFGAVPNEGFWKQYQKNGVDFFTVRGYIDLQASRHINIQFGHDKNFIGNGIRSMFLSDISSNYFFLKLTTRVWRLNYTNLFVELVADAPFTPFGTLGGSLGTSRFPKKYMALHHLSINLSDNFNIGLFEATVFSNEDSVGGRFELNYLNPIIFYRGIEQMVGSPDNALIGMDFKWNPGTHLSFYGQFLLDEMVISDLVNGSGWWGNKVSGQLGLKYIDALGIANLDLQIESNFARPYTYSHESSFTNYSHYRQPLAHPLGANFSEMIFLTRYQPIPKLSFNGKLILANQGKDPIGLNYGSNVLLSYNTRPNDYDNTLGQGVDTKIRLLDITASYQLRHNFFIDLKQIIRMMDSENNTFDQTTVYTALSLRLNTAQRLLDF